jgi:predicted regulator of Ras-like GTPase activity (Roadblock/LC7/MglB family)
MNDLSGTDPLGASRAYRLDRAIQDLLATTPEIEAVAVVSFDGLPMASALPAGMEEDRVAAMSAALLSLGDRAAQGLGRGELSQVYIEGDAGTVFLVSAEDEAVLVAVAAKGAKAGMMLYEVRRTAAAVADVLRVEPPAVDAPAAGPAFGAHALAPAPTAAPAPAYTAPEPVVPTQSPWASSLAAHGTVMPGTPSAPTWS